MWFWTGLFVGLRITVDDVLQKHNISAETFCSDLETAAEQSCDLVIASGEIERRLEDVGVPVIVVNDFLSSEEVEEKVLPVIRELLKKD